MSDVSGIGGGAGSTPGYSFYDVPTSQPLWAQGIYDYLTLHVDHSCGGDPSRVSRPNFVTKLQKKPAPIPC